ncbi:hypothetical protein BDF20DRAFT_911901 [Mycotypha africana]|uniref:uncharacterized protein n=1 Tax=Mycotypha africana TaxID=64632 RepID=UPI00230193D9|nr:uncharacterized protein BDF20DRAFT_911901 [Mycotypha africana]KAI8981628.1 hypothetical protein BDF20DRAFT_911901 [Mycotypha africana]
MANIQLTKYLLLRSANLPWLLTKPKSLSISFPANIVYNNTALITATTTTTTTRRCIHVGPNKQYNGIQTAAHHFKQQRHMPYFLEYLMWAVFGSEALHLIWLKMDYKEYREKTAHKKKVLEELIERIEQGEVITDSLREEIKMVLLNKHDKQHKLTAEDFDDEYLAKLIEQTSHETVSSTRNNDADQNIHKEESKWLDEDKIVRGADKKSSKEKAFFL